MVRIDGVDEVDEDDEMNEVADDATFSTVQLLRDHGLWKESDMYLHRVGRAGRFGTKAVRQRWMF